MYVLTPAEFPFLYGSLAAMLSQQQPVRIGEWHAQEVDTRFIELNGVSLEWVYPVGGIESLQKEIEPNLPWAEDHFQERVSGTPLNPPPSAENWPFAQKNHTQHKMDNKFSHTYPERFWPKHANTVNVYRKRQGIRYAYGDLLDVASLLARSVRTRQAYVPIWFPEDTGAVDGQRVPCTLGYHFMIRNGMLSCTYMIRSCDFVRHFRDDFYMTARLISWMCERVNTLAQDDVCEPGNLTMHIMNLHAFESDLTQLRLIGRRWNERFWNTGDGHVEQD